MANFVTSSRRSRSITWTTCEWATRPSAAITARVSGSAARAARTLARNPASSIGAASRYVLPSLSIDTDSVTGVVSAVAPFGRSSGIALDAT